MKAGDMIAELEEERLELDLEFAQLAVETAKEDLAQPKRALVFDRREAELDFGPARNAGAECKSSEPGGCLVAGNMLRARTNACSSYASAA